MKILIVEDDELKREVVQKFLEEKNVDMHFCSLLRPAVRYAIEHSNEISGIILDLGLRSFPDSNDYYPKMGLELVYDLTYEEIDIPILINSSTVIEDLDQIMEWNSNLKGQTCITADSYQKLEEFVTFLKQRDEQ